MVPAPSAVDPELSTRPQRRRFMTAEKLRILAEIDQARQGGGIGSILRREGLYWSTLSRWREQRAAGMVKGLTPAKRGRQAAKPSPEAVELAQLRREYARLQQRLDRAEAIIDLQKKLRSCWGFLWPSRTRTIRRDCSRHDPAVTHRGRGSLCGVRFAARQLLSAASQARATRCSTPTARLRASPGSQRTTGGTGSSAQRPLC